MTVVQLIEELKKWPQDMPIAIGHHIDPSSINEPHWIEIQKCIWTHNNFPYNLKDFEYLNLN